MDMWTLLWFPSLRQPLAAASALGAQWTDLHLQAKRLSKEQLLLLREPKGLKSIARPWAVPLFWGYQHLPKILGCTIWNWHLCRSKIVKCQHFLAVDLTKGVCANSRGPQSLVAERGEVTFSSWRLCPSGEKVCRREWPVAKENADFCISSWKIWLGFFSLSSSPKGQLHTSDQSQFRPLQRRPPVLLHFHRESCWPGGVSRETFRWWVILKSCRYKNGTVLCVVPCSVTHPPHLRCSAEAPLVLCTSIHYFLFCP